MKHLNDYLMREDADLTLDPVEDPETGEQGWEAMIDASKFFHGPSPLAALWAANAWCARQLGRTP